MDFQEHIEIIENLRDDEKYFGSYGQNFLSNSMIKTLLTDPRSYGKEVEKTSAMLRGTYVHQQLLKPKREKPLFISEAGSRNAKIYKEEKEEAGESILLLRKEVDDIDLILDRVKKNETFIEYLTANLKDNEIEEPGIVKINGVWFKAKADRINNHVGKVFDIKTTSDIRKFKNSFYQYGYDTASYIYKKVFGMDMAFLVIDMTTGALGYYEVSEETLLAAEAKIYRALAVKDLYFGEGEGDLDQIIDFGIL